MIGSDPTHLCRLLKTRSVRALKSLVDLATFVKSQCSAEWLEVSKFSQQVFPFYFDAGSLCRYRCKSEGCGQEFVDQRRFKLHLEQHGGEFRAALPPQGRIQG